MKTKLINDIQNRMKKHLDDRQQNFHLTFNEKTRILSATH